MCNQCVERHQRYAQNPHTTVHVRSTGPKEYGKREGEQGNIGSDGSKSTAAVCPNFRMHGMLQVQAIQISHEHVACKQCPGQSVEDLPATTHRKQFGFPIQRLQILITSGYPMTKTAPNRPIDRHTD